MVTLIFMWITIISYKFLGKVVKLVNKMLRLKFFEIDLDTYLEIKIFLVIGYVWIELVYYIFVNKVTICFLKVYTITK